MASGTSLSLPSAPHQPFTSELERLRGELIENSPKLKRQPASSAEEIVDGIFKAALSQECTVGFYFYGRREWKERSIKQCEFNCPGLQNRVTILFAQERPELHVDEKPQQSIDLTIEQLRLCSLSVSFEDDQTPLQVEPSRSYLPLICTNNLTFHKKFVVTLFSTKQTGEDKDFSASILDPMSVGMLKFMAACNGLL